VWRPKKLLIYIIHVQSINLSLYPYDRDRFNNIVYRVFTLYRNDLILWNKNECSVNKTSLYNWTSTKRILVGGHRLRVSMRYGTYRYRWPASVAASRHLQAGTAMTLHIHLCCRWLTRCYRVGRPASVVGRCPGDRGSGYVHDTWKRAVVSVGHICSSVVVIGSPPPPIIVYTTPLRVPISSVIVWRVCVGTVCRRVRVSSTFYQTGEIKREKK